MARQVDGHSVRTRVWHRWELLMGRQVCTRQLVVLKMFSQKLQVMLLRRLVSLVCPTTQVCQQSVKSLSTVSATGHFGLGAAIVCVGVPRAVHTSLDRIRIESSVVNEYPR